MGSGERPAGYHCVCFFVGYQLLNLKINIWKSFSPIFPLLSKAFSANPKLRIITCRILSNEAVNRTFIALVSDLVKEVLGNLF